MDTTTSGSRGGRPLSPDSPSRAGPREFGSPDGADAADAAAAAAEAKRRKIRKGTRSCWECKRRKIRCTFASPTDPVCIGCHRRGAHCVSQEFPEEASSLTDRGRHMGDRIVRVEALIEKLVKQVSTDGGAGPTPPDSTSAPDSTSTSTTRGVAFSGDDHTTCFNPNPDLPTPDGSMDLDPQVASDSSKNERISAALYAALPCRGDLQLLKRYETEALIFFNLLGLRPYSEIDRDGLDSPSHLFSLPDPRSHPVVLGKHLLLLAKFLQYFRPFGLSENHVALRERLLDTVKRLVTSDDELVSTFEGLECVYLEGLFHCNNGNLRHALTVMRRAMVIAQLMGLHRTHNPQPLKKLNPTTTIDPSFLWYRIVYADRFLCMMLGLPQGTLSTTMASPAALASESDTGRLERTHTVIMSRILERNESDPCATDYSLTQEIDLELQKASKLLPSRWWLMPTLDSTTVDKQTFLNTMRLLNQLFHYNLLNQLHLPYMLRSDDPSNQSEGRASTSYNFSKMTCVNASREVLRRFVEFRSFNRIAFCCRAIDFFALVGAMTLLLAHLYGHRQRVGENILAHQRLSDRAIMEEVLERMDGINENNGDSLSQKSADILRHLLALENEAAEGRSVCPGHLPCPQEDRECDEDEDDHVLRMIIPYFGIIKIAKEGVISKESPRKTQPSAQAMPQSLRAHSNSAAPNSMGVPGLGDGCLPPISCDKPAAGINLESPAQPDSQLQAQAPLVNEFQFAPQFPTGINDALQEQYQYPGLTAPVNDWALQGVDMAFFDSLMRGNTPASSNPSVPYGGQSAQEGQWEDWQPLAKHNPGASGLY
ncbi:hypothetical protein B0T26DRAFT_639666 [Lasiosphaeria miniovina]|uniref:Zn(2)-C6 fungal-type domain-containing protein n=1 Tax=Lasiosphaeria miniovina TaxID=1954250 RepID=A0AA40E7E7_9PEZI|nr:uncharacterized protein B0T26DRAFT_639666 [Lasiosphaeria miniovina]KAK0727822.1 hypothetical protein B0T26DRAFT_639666 [Lasiosphaeria miniovina]